MRDSGFGSTGPNFVKSTFGHGSRFSSPPPRRRRCCRCRRRALARHHALDERGDVALRDAALRTGALHARHVDAEFARELAHRRRRMARRARAASPAGITRRLRERGRRRRCAATASRARRTALRPLRVLRGGRGAARQRRLRASSTTITVPSETVSPTLTFTSLTVPAAGLGTSIVALSDSSVTSDCSFSTLIADLHARLSMTGMSLKSPISGTFTSLQCRRRSQRARQPEPARRGAAAGAAGARWRGAGAAAPRRAAFQHDDQRAFRHVVADLDLHFLDDAGGRTRHVHRRLVGFERDERLLFLDGVTRLHQHLDHGDVLVIADVRHLDFDRLTHY